MYYATDGMGIDLLPKDGDLKGYTVCKHEDVTTLETELLFFKKFSLFCVAIALISFAVMVIVMGHISLELQQAEIVCPEYKAFESEGE